ncbi:MAG: pyruvate dehydrogenase (acetyl-transferring) E1 component subunit alpha [Gammaproteobacteria bacterium]|nr:pyruvate dehydrogenase (acetyl-transferring) E1 component subunit alpha [Gammaproteobacteria bacterium]MDE2345531.1 pyruvate dehydrogenase (acetyl-transferring) E1 component subunit alpha [Gammaproteobacteria bacterium]
MKTVASFEIKYLQYLDSDGRLTQKKLPKFAENPDELLKMYRMMSFVRVFDTKSIALQRTGQLGTYASCLGHEATHVGIGAAMRPEDAFFPMYREYGAQFWRGVKPHEVLLFWGGDERGNNFSGPAHDFAWAVPIATQCHHAAGAALAFKLRGEKRAAVSVIGDGGTSQGDFYESLNAAGAYQLPVVFVVSNNKWAISVPLAAQTACETLAQKAIAGGFEGIQVDGNDIIAVRDIMEYALHKARSGKGPTLVEALTYRLSDHTTADDATRYRDKREVEEARKQEPLIRLRKYLTDMGAWDQKKEAKLLEECSAQMDAEVKLYKDTGKPPVASMFDHMFANMPENLLAQRDAAVAEEQQHG